MKIPQHNLSRRYTNHKSEWDRLFGQVMGSGAVLKGPTVTEVEEQIAALSDRRFAVAVGSCTDALGFSFLSQKIGPGDQVLVTSLSFIASLSGILRCGAEPVFVDIDSRSCLMDLSLLERHLTAKTKAVLAVDIYGQLFDESLAEFCERNELLLIGDAAQAFGSRLNDRCGGGLGKISCFSFEPTKVLTGFATTGIAVTDCEESYASLRQLRYHGLNEQSGEYVRVGYNSQISTLSAACLLHSLQFAEVWQNRRRQIAKHYIDSLKDLPIRFPQVNFAGELNWHKFVMEVDNRNALATLLKENSIEPKIHYNRPLYHDPLVKTPAARCENTESICQRLVSLPMNSELYDEEVEIVIRTVRQFFD